MLKNKKEQTIALVARMSDFGGLGDISELDLSSFFSSLEWKDNSPLT